MGPADSLKPGQLRDTAHETQDTTPRTPFTGSDVGLLTSQIMIYRKEGEKDHVANVN